MMDLPVLRIAIVIVIAAVVVLKAKSSLWSKKIPSGTKPLPGPKGRPIIGNAFDIPKSHAWLKFKEWADEYGPIYQVNAMGTTLIVISKESIANDLLALRGATYSDRPSLIMTSLITEGGFLGAMPWSDYWRRGRRFTQSMLSTSSVQQFVPKQTIEARQMVIDLAKDQSKYPYWLERAGVMTSVKQMYGVTVERGIPEEERHVQEIINYMEQIDRVATPGQYLVELVPSLLYLPTWLAPFKQEANRLVKRHWDYLAPLTHHQFDRYRNKHPENPESFARRYVKSKEDWGLNEREIVWVLASIYGGAAGTSSTAMQSIILNTCLFPEWQTHMQKEIENVVGGDRLPNFDDFSSLPTVRAFIKESMRWRPVLSGGFPHAVTKDDIYEGYHIPKGAVIIPNQWAILRDPDLYPDPDSFKPERWLKPGFPTYQEPLTQYPNLKRFAGFGHGRRFCPGWEVTEKSLFLQVSNLYWACSIRPEKDANGNEAEIPWYDYTGVTLSAPRKFRFQVKERVSGRLKLMEKAAIADYDKDVAAAQS